MRAIVIGAVAGLAAPAFADDDPAQAAWLLFAKHCGAFVEAESFADSRAAMDGLDSDLTITQDGWGLLGSATIPGELDSPTLAYGGSGDADGRTRYCLLQITAFDGETLPDLAATASENAEALLGEDHQRHGGPFLKGENALALGFETPGFPPRLELVVRTSLHHVSLHLTLMRAAD